jgi:hypothetical protein
MRVSDNERQRVIDELRRHCVAGRLDVDEYASRIEQALAATSLEDLDRVLGDLPMVRIADPAGTSAASDSGGYARFGGSSDTSAGGKGWSARLRASAVVLVSVIVVVGAVVLATALSWAWAAVLVAGWLLGVVQARVLARRRR